MEFGLDKIQYSSSSIRFFFFDVLDYALLKNHVNGFVQELSCFDIRAAVDEVINSKQAGLKLKQLHLSKTYQNFIDIEGKDNYVIKTDKRRL